MTLSKVERLVLHHLAWGKPYREIVAILNQARATLYPEKKYVHGFYNSIHLHCICGNIRKKTGISNTKDPVECRQWERDNRYTPKQVEKGPTAQQLQILQLIAEDFTYDQIAQKMGLAKQSILNLASQARKRAKLSNTLRRTVREYLLEMARLQSTPPPAPTMDDPAFN